MFLDSWKSEDFPIIIEEIPWLSSSQDWASTVGDWIPGQAELRSCMLHGVAKQTNQPKGTKKKNNGNIIFPPCLYVPFSYLYVPVKELIMYSSPLVNSGKKNHLNIINH